MNEDVTNEIDLDKFIAQVADIYNTCQGYVILFLQSGEIIWCNKYTEGVFLNGNEMTRLTIDELLKDAFRIVNGKLEVLKKYEEGSNETIIYKSDLTCIHIKLHIAYLYYENQKIGVCHANDIEEVVELRTKLKELESMQLAKIKDQDQLLGNVTHELKTPLNGITGMVDILLEEDHDEEVREIAKVIKKSCRNMLEIVNMILTFAELQSGNGLVNEYKFSLANMIDNTVQMLTPVVNEKCLKLYVRISDDIPDVLLGDELKLSGILTNLLTNAVKFTQFGFIILDVIKIAEYDDEMKLYFSVMDTGIGISEKDKERLFKSFSQVDGSIRRRFGGSGLGLAITKGLIELMDGQIWVESEEGKGSTFSFVVKIKIAIDEEIKQEVKKHTTNENRVGAEVGYLQSIMKSKREEIEQSESYHYIMRLKKFGTDENKNEILDNLKKLLICSELNGWDKSETLMANIKCLIPESEEKFRNKLFQIEMNARKKNKEKTVKFISELITMINEVE